jgi:poly(3-hydroxybutyrate) depolymerase
MICGNARVRAAVTILALLALATAGARLHAQRCVTFASVGDGRNGRPDPVVDAYLYRPPATGAQPALVFLHGCAGLVGASGEVKPRETDWAERMAGLG